MGNIIYTSITEETLKGARDRALEKLEELTGGFAQEAIQCAKEILEFDKIIEEWAKR